VPLLLHPVFADFMAAYGKAGTARLLPYMARLYWFTVEFGLIATRAGLRIYGAGIASSAAESVLALDSASPHRLRFNLERVMRTAYRIDDFQPTYFVIDDYDELFGLLDWDLSALCERLKRQPRPCRGTARGRRHDPPAR